MFKGITESSAIIRLDEIKQFYFIAHFYFAMYHHTNKLSNEQQKQTEKSYEL